MHFKLLLNRKTRRSKRTSRRKKNRYCELWLIALAKEKMWRPIEIKSATLSSPCSVIFCISLHRLLSALAAMHIESHTNWKKKKKKTVDWQINANFKSVYLFVSHGAHTSCLLPMAYITLAHTHSALWLNAKWKLCDDVMNAHKTSVASASTSWQI